MDFDSSGNLKVAIGAGATAGTEYTEDAASAANPVGGMVMARRRDTLVTNEVSADGDNIAINATNKGALHVADEDARTSLAVIDDWDESDRAKVNLIVGQAGVAAGAGAVGATVQRVTLASDDPLVAKVPASLGPKTAAASLSVVPGGLEYETVAASQTAQALGGTGATGDFLSHVIIQPTTTAPGVVTVLDNAVEVHAYPGGTVGADLTPIHIVLNARSVSGAWKITTGANVKATAYGAFTA